MSDKETVKRKQRAILRLLFTLSYIKVIDGRVVWRGHNQLNDLSKWTMVWLHPVNPCHFGCHHSSLGSHTSMKTRKMSPLTHFTEKAARVYRSPHPSLNTSCLGEESQTHFDLYELSGFLSMLLSGTEWHQWTSLSWITVTLVLFLVWMGRLVF